jgi:hypothetical protein
MAGNFGPRGARRQSWTRNIADNVDQWGDPSPDDVNERELVEEEDELEEELEDGLEEALEEAPSEILPCIPHKKRRLSKRRRLPLECRYPVWERKVRLTGEARIECNDPSFYRRRLIPQEVCFTSPPTLTREIIICGFVVARLIHRGHTPRRVALPFQATFTAWPVQALDLVVEDFICFAGARVCPILATSPNGRVYKACELKVAFDALVRVFHPLRRP